MKHCLLGFIALLLALPATLNAADAPQPKQPNIIFILIDDMGWTDLACFGSKFYETPNIDRLAAHGMRFNNAYAACTVCSPSRAALMTGKYPARLHITNWIPGQNLPKAKLKIPDWLMHLPLEEMNIAQALKPAGYATASIGKWHLGKEPYWPEKQGFDLNIAGCDKGSPPSYFAPYRLPTLTEGPAGEFLTERLADEAIKFIEQNKDRPFFAYLPNYAVHQPIAARQAVIAKYKAKADPSAPHNNPTYAALIESVDDGVGRILTKLDDLGIADRTIIFFTSDNGGLMRTTSNAPLRAGKGSAYEGGVRAPLIVRWPGVTKPGSLCATPVITVDYYPTLLAMAGVGNDPKHTADGESLVPLLRQTGSLQRDAIYWHYPHYHPGGATPYSAIRQGDLRLVEFHEDNHVELYNLKDDIGEQHNLAAELLEKTAALRDQLHRWRESVGAQMPTPNANYDPKAADPKKPKAKRKNDRKEQTRASLDATVVVNDE